MQKSRPEQVNQSRTKATKPRHTKPGSIGNAKENTRKPFGKQHKARPGQTNQSKVGEAATVQCQAKPTNPHHASHCQLALGNTMKTIENQ